jgi:hypothetical protein
MGPGFPMGLQLQEKEQHPRARPRRRAPARARRRSRQRRRGTRPQLAALAGVGARVSAFRSVAAIKPAVASKTSQDARAQAGASRTATSGADPAREAAQKTGRAAAQGGVSRAARAQRQCLGGKSAQGQETRVRACLRGLPHHLQQHLAQYAQGSIMAMPCFGRVRGVFRACAGPRRVLPLQPPH